jgi:hypothetical protein
VVRCVFLCRNWLLGIAVVGRQVRYELPGMTA